MGRAVVWYDPVFWEAPRNSCFCFCVGFAHRGGLFCRAYSRRAAVCSQPSVLGPVVSAFFSVASAL
eukprot:2695056-Lingulodinium_polyedra.AAC.1